jgi:hypothetical protein
MGNAESFCRSSDCDEVRVLKFIINNQANLQVQIQAMRLQVYSIISSRSINQNMQNRERVGTQCQ